MKTFSNATVYVEGRGIVKTDLSFDARIRSFTESPEGKNIPLPEGALVLPGFVDQHIHGSMGADCMDGTKDALDVISRALAKEGTTTFLATTMTAEESALASILSTVATYESTAGARLVGVHLEGPYLSPRYAGAQSQDKLALPSVEQFDRLQAAAGGKIRLVTLAPELPGADALLSHLENSGVRASVGHSGATFDRLLAARGLTAVTHTYNAMSPFHHREPGVVGAALLFDDLYCELICDGLHVAFPAVDLLVKSKPKDKLILVTDSMRAKGLPDGRSELGGQTVLVKNREARLADGTLAGSTLAMNRAVKNLSSRPGMALTSAVDCATINPARHLGIDGDCGSIALGKRADFTILNESLDVIATYVAGERVF